MNPITEYFDPLYKYIDLRRLDPSLLSCIETPEFARQAFLRQSGLKFLVFPSATHTRFAHAIGACHLGILAMDRVKVEVIATSKSVGPMLLKDFLEAHKVTKLFLATLLLHDIGHFPFSHTLERNEYFRTYFASHEAVACQIILNEGKVPQSIRDRVLGHGIKEKSNFLSNRIEACLGKANRLAMCYLICGDSGKKREYLRETLNLIRQHTQRDKQRQVLEILYALISGLLDLDRIDHYRRDSFFSGVGGGAALNYLAMLQGLTVTSHFRKDSNKVRLSLSADAIGQAIALLQSKERLTEDVFEHPTVLCYEAMLNSAISTHLYRLDRDARESRAQEFAAMTDDELLSSLSTSADADSQRFARRIMLRSPFHFVAKLVCNQVKYSLEQIATEAETMFGGRSHSGAVLIHTSPNYNRGLGPKKKKISKQLGNEWLDLGKVEFSNNGKYNGLNRSDRLEKYKSYFQDAQINRQKAVWIFTEETCASVEKIEKLARWLNAQVESDGAVG